MARTSLFNLNDERTIHIKGNRKSTPDRLRTLYRIILEVLFLMLSEKSNVILHYYDITLILI